MCMLAATVVACDNGGGGPDLTEIVVTPASTTLPQGATQQMVATARFSNNTTEDVTSRAQWESTMPAVATVGGKTGLVKAVAASGSTVIRATFEGKQGSAGITAAAAAVREVQVTPSAPSVPKGLSLQFKATALFTDNRTPVDVTDDATWKSSAEAVATVNDSGNATTLSVGTSTISADFGGKSGSTVLTVNIAVLEDIQVNPSPAAMPRGGFTQQFTATGIFSDDSTADLTTQVTWASSDTTVATISNVAGNRGLATSVGAGSSNITARLNSLTSTPTVLTVNSDTLTGISVTPATTEIALGQSQLFKATGSFSGSSAPRDISDLVTWSSSNQAIATISNAAGSRGLAVSQSVGGPVTISAQRGDLSSGASSASLTVTAASLQSIEVSPMNAVVPNGFNRNFSATGTFSDGSTGDVTNAVTWVSSNSNVATISNAGGSKGQARGGAPGQTTISARSGDVEGSTALQVIDAALSSIRVAPATASIPLGTTQAFSATGVFAGGFEMDITEQVDSWLSADDNIATVSNVAGSRGVASAKAQGGPVAISAKKGSVSASASLTVTSAAITGITVRQPGDTCSSVTPPDVDTFLPKGFKAGFIACASFTDGDVRDVTTQATWSSQATTVATVSNDAGSKGTATAVESGRTVVVASLGGRTDTAPIEVTNATLASIDVTPKAQTMSGSSPGIQYNAVGTFSDTRTLPITTQVNWTSSSSSVVISNAAASKGRATPSGSVLTSTTVTITATRDSVSGSTTLTRTP
jgi:hypothetical protein